MKKVKLISLGSDPEFFIKKGDIYFPPFMFTTGTKTNPELIERHPGYSILLDNMTIEGNIPPAYSSKEFIENMLLIMEIIDTRLRVKSGYTLAHESAVVFKPRFLKSPKSKEIGCAPDLNAFINVDTDVRTNNLLSFMSLPYRAAGFHIHIGYNIDDFDPRTQFGLNRLIAQLFELFVVIPFEQQFSGNPVNNYRKLMYGIGEFFGYYRNKPYGLECRGLGSYFTRLEYMTHIWTKVQLIFSFINSVDNLKQLLDTSEKGISTKAALSEIYTLNTKIKTIN